MKLDFLINWVLFQVASMLPEEAFSVIRKSFDARKVGFSLIPHIMLYCSFK